MDALSEVLNALKLNSGIFLELSSPRLGASIPRRARTISAISPDAKHVTLYHLLTEGHCHARIPGVGETVDLEAGDLIMFPHGDGHRMGSDLQLSPLPAVTFVVPAASGGLAHVDFGGGGARTRFVCGFLECDSRLCKPLLDSLPRMFKVPLGNGSAASWIIDTLHRGAAETLSPRAGTDAVLAKLSELLFVKAMRYYLESLSDSERGWFAGLRDPQISRVLALMHAAPERAWTVEDLVENPVCRVRRCPNVLPC